MVCLLLLGLEFLQSLHFIAQNKSPSEPQSGAEREQELNMVECLSSLLLYVPSWL